MIGDGFINIIKPPGMSSHDVVGLMRRTLGVKRIGHSGTLDPAAAGVLPLGVGRATRLLEYAGSGRKGYHAEVCLGVTTNTGDATGETIGRYHGPALSRGEVEQALHAMMGTVEQRPPMFSAVHYQGQRLYELARKGQVVEPPPRRVVFYDLKIMFYHYPRLAIKVTCSRGTYIRSLAHDLGEKLGCGAHLGFLLRDMTGPFTIDSGQTWEEIAEEAAGGGSGFLLPPDFAVAELPMLQLTAEAEKRVRHGAPAGEDGFVSPAPKEGDVRLYGKEKSFLGIGTCSSGENGTLVRVKKMIAGDEKC